MKKIIIGLGLCGLLAAGGPAGTLGAQETTFTNSLGLEFALIPAGSFTMGLKPQAGAGDEDAAPEHTVTISRPFYLGTREVTQAQWEEVMGSNPSRFRGRNNPVEQVSWDEVQTFIRKLNEREGGERYRLPTEAEWEYAARAGTGGAYFFGADAGDLDRYAWYGANSGEKTRPVGQKRPNPLGLYDMYGNVWEWAADRYGAKYYPRRAQTDPQGPSRGAYRVLRGGGWSNTAAQCRSANRFYYAPDGRFACVGFRLAFTPER